MLTRPRFRGEGRTSWEASYPNPREKSASDHQKNAGFDSGKTSGGSSRGVGKAPEKYSGGSERR